MPNPTPAAPANQRQLQLQHDMQFAEMVLLEKGTVAPMFVLHTPSGAIPVVAPFANDEEKARIYELVQLLCIAEDATALVFVAEAWVRTLAQRKGETEAEIAARGRAMRPSEAEDRIEVVMVSGGFRDEAAGEIPYLYEMREILRDAESGKPIGLAPPLDQSEEGQMTGAVTKILPAARPTPQEREAARALLEEQGIQPRREPATHPGNRKTH